MTMKKPLAVLLAFLALGTVSAEITSIEKDLSYDENGKLATHYLLYPAGNPGCAAATFPITEGYESHAISGDALSAVFPGAREGYCIAVCLERGTDRAYAYAAMPERHWDGTSNFKAWFDETCKKVEVCMMNYHSRSTPVKLIWVAPDGKRVPHLDVSFGERGTRCFQSYVGHIFEAVDGDTGELLETIEIEYITTKAIGVSPPSGDPKGHNFDAEIERTLHNEWRRQSRVTRTFSPLGFKKGRLPDDLFASMGAFYYNNRHNTVREEWNGKGVFVNWWETDCSFVQIPWNLKGRWQERLRELVEIWAGVPVEQTDMYGLRQYEHGARLLTHVDREATHAVSLIVNIAQGNLTEPWPVEVNDHGNRLHEVIMSPGDIVYYESAKCLHGRNRPLTGPNAYYTNLFTHYRPIGDPKWFLKPNDEGVPEPVLDVEGECRLEKVMTTETANKQLAFVEAVKCDDERLGPHVSPSLFKTTGGEDMIEWWRMTAPPQKETITTDGRDEL